MLPLPFHLEYAAGSMVPPAGTQCIGGTGGLVSASEPAGKAPPSVDLSHALGGIQVPLKSKSKG